MEDIPPLRDVVPPGFADFAAGAPWKTPSEVPAGGGDDGDGDDGDGGDRERFVTVRR
jgi:hypothetical protein